MRARSIVLQALVALPLMAAPTHALAQSAAEYSAWLNWCRGKGWVPNNDPNRPLCSPPEGASGSGYSSSDQALLGIAGAIGSALGNAIRESIEAAERQAAMQRMQMEWELERARIFAAEERERLSREMRERNETLIANLKGGVRVPDLTISNVGTSQLKLKTADEMFGRPTKVAAVDPAVAWNGYLAALQKRNEASLRLAAATDHKAAGQVILDAARKQLEAARLSGSAEKLAEAEKLVAQAEQLSEQATADLATAKAEADAAAGALEQASAAATGIELAAATAAASLPGPAESPPTMVAVEAEADPMVVDLRDHPPAQAAPAVDSDAMVVDARNIPSILEGLPRLEEVENSPGREAWLAGMAAASKSDWDVAVPEFEAALQKDPGNAALARAVELARWTREHRRPAPPAPAPRDPAVEKAYQDAFDEAQRQFVRETQHARQIEKAIAELYEEAIRGRHYRPAPAASPPASDDEFADLYEEALIGDRLRSKSAGSPPKAQWQIEYEAKVAAYQQELEKQRAAVADYERAQAEFAAKRAQMAEQARKKREEWERAVAACAAGDHSACGPAPK